MVSKPHISGEQDKKKTDQRLGEREEKREIAQIKLYFVILPLIQEKSLRKHMR